MKTKEFVVCSPPYDLNSGGGVVLHYLCYLLNQLGETAYMFFNDKIWVRKRRHFEKTLFRNDFKNKLYQGNFENAIVIYPERIRGNPYGAKNVVRFLLHKPGFHTRGKICFGKDDLVVGWGKECSGSGYNITDENNIKIIYNMDDVYYQTNFNERTKTCYMIRKANKPYYPRKHLDAHPNDAICVDHKSHIEIAKIFNECDRFICYDPYTHYSTFATKCGCTSIVIPDEGVSKEDWKPNVKDTYGIAYGLNDIEYAKETKDKFLEYQKEIEQNNIDAVRKFVKLCENYFVN